MSLSDEDVRRYVENCDPQQPLRPGDPRYIAFDEDVPVRGSDVPSCVDALSQPIRLTDPTARTCQLFTGFPGTGKTTELLRLKAKLELDQTVPTRAIYVNFEEYVDRFVPLSVSDVLRVLAYVLDREALIVEGKDPDQAPGYLKRFFDFISQTDVELKGIGFSTYGATLMAELKNNPAFRKKAEEALKLRFQEFAKQAEEVMTDAVVRIRQATGEQRVVLIADSLEKLTPLREEDRTSMESSVEALFVQHCEFLKAPCHVVYTFPLWLRFRTAALGACYHTSPLILPMVKIAATDGKPYQPGAEKLRQLVAKRVDLANVFGADAGAMLGKLVSASGGYPRDLLRMTRDLLLRAAGRFPVGDEMVESVISRLAEEYSQVIRSDDLDLICDVARNHELPLGDERKLAAFGRLLERWLVLAYRNGKTWYDVHPLVRRSNWVQARLASQAG